MENLDIFSIGLMSMDARVNLAAPPDAINQWSGLYSPGGHLSTAGRANLDLKQPPPVVSVTT